MPQIALPVALAIAEVTGATVSVAAVQIGLTVAAVGGLAVASSALQRSLKPDIPGDLGPAGLQSLASQEVKASVKQSTPAQRIWRGAQRGGGAFAFYKVKSGSGKLYIQHMYSRRKLSKIVAVNVNGNRLLFPSPQFGTVITPLTDPNQPDYPHRFRACFQAGTLNQPLNPLLAQGFPDLTDPTKIGAGNEWRLPGIANAVYEFQYGSNFDEFQALWGNVQIPDVQPELWGCPVHDPRVPTSQLPSDPNDIEEWFAAQETWPYSANAALHQADHLWQPDGLNAGPEAVDWDKVAEAADRADEAAATRDTAITGKYEKRYAIGGITDLSQAPADIFDGLLTASRATLIQANNGKCWPSHDAPKTPVFTITDAMLLGAVTYRGFKGRHDLANKATMRFVAPSQSYQQTDGPPLIRSDLIAADGGILALNVDLPYTTSPSTAQRIAKADLEEARIERSWSGAISLEALGIREDDCVQIASEICPHWNGLYVVDKWTLTFNLSGQSGIGLSLIGYDASIVGDWNAATDDQPFTLTDTTDLLAA